MPVTATNNRTSYTQGVIVSFPSAKQDLGKPATTLHF
jgi:hypothetical protein